jgi:hypothetical protein
MINPIARAAASKTPTTILSKRLSLFITSSRKYTPQRHRVRRERISYRKDTDRTTPAGTPGVWCKCSKNAKKIFYKKPLPRA